MTATTMHFGPEWMRTKHQTPTRPQQPPSPPPNTQSTYSALVSTIPGVENEKHDDVHPFRYSKEELIRIYGESPKGDLGLEVERWEGVVREIGAEPVALREMGEAEKKLFSGPLNSDLRRRQSTDYLSLNMSSLGTERPRLGHAPSSATASPLRDRFKRRDSNADSPSTTMTRKISLSSLQAPNIASRSAALPSPRNRPGYPSFDGVLSSGDTWSTRRRTSEASLKPGGISRESSGETEDKAGVAQGDDTNGSLDSARNNDSTTDGKVPNVTATGTNPVPESAPSPNPGVQDLASVEWSYKDPSGNIQGPFRADLMQKWFDDGYFTMDLPMKRTHLDTTWMTLEELIKRASIPDKMFLSPLVAPGPPGLSRRNGSPLQAGIPQTEHNVFSNPYQPSPIRTLRSSTLDSLNGTNPTDSPISTLGHFGNNSPDSLAFANRANPGYAGDASNLGFSGGIDLAPLRQRHVADLAHESPLHLHSPSYNALLGNHPLGYDNYGYSGFTPVQSSPWGTPTQPYANYNPHGAFGGNNFNPAPTFNLSHHTQPLGGQVNTLPHLYGNQDYINQQQQQIPNQGYFDPTLLINGVLNEQNIVPLNNQQFQNISPVEAKPSIQNENVGYDLNQDNATVESPTAGTSWDATNNVTRRAGPFDSHHPTTLNTAVPAAVSQVSPWGEPAQPARNNLQAPPNDPSPWVATLQEIIEPAWTEPIDPTAPEPIGQKSGPVSPVEDLSTTNNVAPAPQKTAAPSDPTPSGPSSKGKGKKASSPPLSPPITEPTETSESPASASTKSPWAKPDKKKGKASTTVSLRDIQDAEAKLAEARKSEKEKERARLAGAALQVDSSQDIQGFTASWGLPTSQAGSRSATTLKEASSTTPSSATPTPPVWTAAAKAPAAKKSLSMKEIQEEEERRKKTAVKETVAVAAAKRGYADQAVKVSAASASVSTPGSAWVTVGSSGKSSVPSGVASRPVVAVVASAPPTVIKSAPLSAGRSAASAVRPAAASGVKVEDFPVSPSHEFLKWLSESLKGLNSSVNVEEIISMLLSFSLDPDPSTVEIISDTIYASSTMLDGRRFAAEFVAKRKADAANRKGVNAAKGPAKPISIAEVVKATPKAAQPEWGFKIVNKKKKGGRA